MNDSSMLHSSKVDFGNVDKDMSVANTMLFRFAHDLKTLVPIDVMLLGNVISMIPLCLNADSPIFVTLAGMVSALSAIQLQNMLSVISVKVAGKLTLFKSEQSAKMAWPILVRLVALERSTVVKLSAPLNALASMATIV